MTEIESGSPEWLRAEAKRYMPGGPQEQGFLAAADEIERLRNCVRWAAETLPCTDHERELLQAAVTGSATPTVVIYEKDDDELSDFHVVATPTEEADDEWADDDPRWEDLAEIEPQGNAGWDHEKDG